MTETWTERRAENKRIAKLLMPERKPDYEIAGSVRGRLYKGKSLRKALQTLQRDQRACAKHGGYSDCNLYENGRRRDVSYDYDGSPFIE